MDEQQIGKLAGLLSDEVLSMAERLIIVGESLLNLSKLSAAHFSPAASRASAGS